MTYRKFTLGRRRLLALAVGVPLATAIACGDGKKSTEAPRAAEQPACPSGLLAGRTTPVEISFWHSMTASAGDTLISLADRFNAAQDRVRVRAMFQGAYGDTRNKYLTALRGGDLPDLVQLEDTVVQLMIDSGSMVAVQDCITAEQYSLADYLDRVTGYWTVGGRLWAVPFNVSTPVLYFNKTAFTRAGLDPNRPPLTLEDVSEYSRAIMVAGAARHGIALEFNATLLEHWFGQVGQPYVDNDNGRAARATRVLFNNDLGRQMFAWLKQVVDAGLGVSVGRNLSGIDDLVAVGTGQAAMALGTSASLRSVLTALSSGQFPGVSAGVGPMPGPRGEGSVLVGGAALWIVNRSAPEKQEAARMFARWLLEPEQQATWHAGSGYIPLRRSAVQLPMVQELWTTQPEFKVAYDQLLAGRTTAASTGPVIGAYDDVREAVIGAIERMWLRGAAPDAALRQAEEESNRAIEEYNRRVRP
jgi:sn-glycerol 3-phosphate transport system substrate-binding protein